tara:strand:- start:65 stop:322 length:258 start_codon:yes stop_codon:yes gene_type:complete
METTPASAPPLIDDGNPRDLVLLEEGHDLVHGGDVVHGDDGLAHDVGGFECQRRSPELFVTGQKVEVDAFVGLEYVLGEETRPAA